jgi:hypothetical protein
MFLPTVSRRYAKTSDCRIVSLNVNGSIQDRGIAGQTTVMSGNTTYELFQAKNDWHAHTIK